MMRSRDLGSELNQNDGPGIDCRFITAVLLNAKYLIDVQSNVLAHSNYP